MCNAVRQGELFCQDELRMEETPPPGMITFVIA